MKPKLSLPERERILKRVIIDGESVTDVCREAGISRVLLYRWLKKYKDQIRFRNLSQPVKFVKNIEAAVSPGKGNISKKPHYEVTTRIRAIQETLSNKKTVTEVCRELNISRTIFYRWLKRYQIAGEAVKPIQSHIISSAQNKTTATLDAGQIVKFDEHKALQALEDKKPHFDRYPGQTDQEYEKLILDAVAHYPELSSHKLVQILPQIGHRPVVGNHGVENVLRRFDLGTYEKRLAYAETAKRTPIVFKNTIAVLLSFLISLSKKPLQTRNRIVAFWSAFSIPVFFSLFLLGLVNYVYMFVQAPSLAVGAGYIFASLALGFGFFFLLYSMKYYASVIMVLLFSRNQLVKEGNDIISRNDSSKSSSGMMPDVTSITLTRHPFVSIHLPLYNEKRVVNRLLEAATSIDYDNYEVIVCDDSTDETKEIVSEWKNHPRVKISHRENREGYKGGALKEALKLMNPQTEFILVFDADFMPFPDSIEQFLKYFQAIIGSLDSRQYAKSKIAALQGYQWHVLNKSENWITRGVRTEYAGSYIVERSSAEIYGGLKQIAGSVYMIRADIMKQFNWGASITEDFELTLRLYSAGFQVAYTPYIQAPSECVSILKRLIRQRMRWAEGHSHNIKKMWQKILFSHNTTYIEKMEFAYLSPYYLQSFFFLLGTLFWFMSEVIFQVRLPFWTAVSGWSLVLTNLFSLPLMNLVGLFLEEAEEKDYLGIFSFIALTYIITPFQAYASVKGFIEKSEGPWFRTPKTGRITDIYRRGRFYRWLKSVFGQVQPSPIQSKNVFPAITPAIAYKNDYKNQYLALATANNRFNRFQINKSPRLSWVAKTALALLLSLTTTLFYFSQGVHLAYATNFGSPLILEPNNSGDANFPTKGNYLTNTAWGGTGTTFVLRNANEGNATTNHLWWSNLLPSGGKNATIPPGNYYLQLAKAGNGTFVTSSVNMFMQLYLASVDGVTIKIIAQNQSYQMWPNNADNTTFQYFIQNIVGNNIVSSAKNRFGLRLGVINGQANANDWVNIVLNRAGGAGNINTSALFMPATLTVPEIPKTVIYIILVVIMPTLPELVSNRHKKVRPKQNIFEEIVIAWIHLIQIVTGTGQEALDDLPV